MLLSTMLRRRPVQQNAFEYSLLNTKRMNQRANSGHAFKLQGIERSGSRGAASCRAASTNPAIVRQMVCVRSQYSKWRLQCRSFMMRFVLALGA